MIHASKSQLNQIEYLIEQSARGNHVLFNNSELRRVFKGRARAEDLTEEEAYAVEPFIERLILEPTLERKRAMLDGLDRRTFETLVRTYFSIVETNLFEKIEARH